MRYANAQEAKILKMEKKKVVPQGYMAVGEVAKRMNTTVRTLQYYDKEGILSPSSESEGGRRLYSDKDIIKLHQIQSLKYLGFSLDDIKSRLVSLETPDEVAAVLAAQAENVRGKVVALSESLAAIEKLREETLKMDAVNWEKYADIVVNLQMKNEFYGLIKYFDDDLLDHVRSRFDSESSMMLINAVNDIFDEVAQLQRNRIPPESEQGQAAAKAWWDIVTEFTGGDVSLLPGLLKFADSMDKADEKFMEDWSTIEPFITKAMKTYFENLGTNPFEGSEEL
jgi:DNA-binding transcriptional MerR regulator